MNKLIPFIFIIISGCSFLGLSKKQQAQKTIFIPSMKEKKLNIIFSHNINGETHPCGCRHFPLGGLPQVAGLIHKLKKSNETIYIDSGDTFFPSSVLPKSLKKSLTFAARNLALGLDSLGLNYFTPGDQDFAAGIEFLSKLSHSVKFQFLISNLANPSVIKHQKYAIIKSGPQKIFLLGLVDPDTLKPRISGYFKPLYKALPESLEEIKKQGYNSLNPLHRLIVVSHSGMPQDQKLAKKYPFINWIIGAHTQSFTTQPYTEAKTRLVQVLSRNHYMGHITIDLSRETKSDTYQIHEVRAELEKEIKDNTFNTFILNHKKKLNEIRKNEQELSMMDFNKNTPLNTVSNCMECHQKQTNFWQGTAHSLAYITLINAKEENNLTCVKCHSLGLNQNHGFYRTKDIVLFQKDTKVSLKKRRKDYWDKIHLQFKETKSIRKLDSDKRRSLSRLWLTRDEASNVTHNFSGVQCLNCHDKNIDHPFKANEEVFTGEKRFRRMKAKCLKCHTKDQSPEWYKTRKFGPPGKLDKIKLIKRMKRVACPRDE